VRLVADPPTELDDTTITDVDPVVVVADRSKRTPDAKVVSRHEPHCCLLVCHASRVNANELDPAWAAGSGRPTSCLVGEDEPGRRFSPVDERAG
jgi:hypothetical protein